MLGSAQVALALVSVLVLACALGTLLPQQADSFRYFERLPNAETWFRAAAIFGFTHVFSSWWFIGLLFILAGGLAACSAARLFAAARSTGVEARRHFCSGLVHSSLVLILLGGLVRVVFGASGTVTLREGEIAAEFTSAGRTLPLPFAMRLERFDVETEPAARPLAGTETVLGASLKNLKSTVTITGAAAATREVISVNQPLARAGIRIYQSTDSARPGPVSKFYIVRDPSIPFVYAGFALLLSSLLFTLYINPWLNSRRVLA